MSAYIDQIFGMNLLIYLVVICLGLISAFFSYLITRQLWKQVSKAEDVAMRSRKGWRPTKEGINVLIIGRFVGGVSCLVGFLIFVGLAALIQWLGWFSFS